MGWGARGSTTRSSVALRSVRKSNARVIGAREGAEEGVQVGAWVISARTEG